MRPPPSLRARPVWLKRTRGLVGFLLLVLACTIAAPARSASVVESADVLIQAGHEGRPDCNREPRSLCNNTGAAGEIRWTPIVADEATRVLRAAGITVLRKPAFLPGTYRVRDAIFIHFDGSVPACRTGASVGYPRTKHSAAAASEWKSLYRRFFPFAFEPDNFTKNLATYYGYHHVVVEDAALVIEGSEISCPLQRAWSGRRLKFEGALIAHFLSRRLGKGTVPLPTAP